MLKRIALTLLPLTLAMPPSLSLAKDDAADDRRVASAGFLKFHPDLQYRGYGLAAYNKQRFEHAMALFRRAAYFADKPAQGMIGEMYANGQGVPRDMSLAYIWMDLAAERGYTGFVLLRERYWKAMTKAEREHALDEGQALYAQFGDDAAKPRFATQLRRGSKEGIGSRTGFTGNVSIIIPGPSGEETMDGSRLKNAGFWDVDKYWAMQDRVWRNPVGAKVNIGDVETVRGQEPTTSRIPETRPHIDAPMPQMDDVPTP